MLELEAFGELTEQQRAFVAAYVGQANGNVRLSSKLAGYAPTAGYALVKRPDIKKAIEAHYAAHMLTASEVLGRLAEQARADHSIYLKVDKAGNLGIDTKGLLAAGLGRNIKSITNGKHGQKLEFYDAQSALVTLGKGLGVLRERVDVTVHVPDLGVVSTRLASTVTELRKQLGISDGAVIEAQVVEERTE